MLVSPAGLASTTEPVDEAAPQPLSATPSSTAPSVRAASTEVLITTQQVLFSTAATVGVRRQNTGGRLVAGIRRMFATSTDASRPRPRHYPKRYGFIENGLMAREMERL